MVAWVIASTLGGVFIGFALGMRSITATLKRRLTVDQRRQLGEWLDQGAARQIKDQLQ